MNQFEPNCNLLMKPMNIINVEATS